MIKKGLWCGYCGTQDFTEIPNPRYPTDSRYSVWECTKCRALFELNDGYGYFTTYWGNNLPGTLGGFCLNSGERLVNSKLPRTPEGIVRHSGSEKELRDYLDRTQIK